MSNTCTTQGLTGHQEKYAERIAKLLAKAESTTSEEAELLVAKAQELMTTYAIDQAMVDAKAGVERDVIVEEQISFRGTYRLATFEIAKVIADANRCKVLQSTGNSRKTIYVIGFKSDVDKVQLLNASLQIQCARAQAAWWKDYDGKGWLSANDKFLARRQFIFSFANGLSSKLSEANAAARAADTEARATAESVSEEQASESVGLVLRARKDRIEDWVDQTYGKLKAGRGRGYNSGGYQASQAGYNAGRSASTSSSLRSAGAIGR